MKIKNILTNLHNKILNLSTFKLILLMFFLLHIAQMIVSPLYKIFPITPTYPKIMAERYNMDSINKLIEVIFRTGVMSPILETLLTQTLVIRIVWGFTRIFFEEKGFWANFIPIIISALIFGMGHMSAYNSYVKVLNTFLAGLIFAYTYVAAYFSNKKASLCVICVHGLWNMYTIALNYFILYVA